MATVQDNLDALTDELIAAIASTGPSSIWSDQYFLEWASRISALQGCNGAAIQSLVDLTPVTTDTFRYSQVGARSEQNEPEVVFRTSGTTAGLRGEHALSRTDVYEASALGAADRLLLSGFEGGHLISLVSTKADAPHSSLAYMIDLFARERFAGSVTWGVGGDGLELSLITQTLFDVSRAGTPTLVFATSLAAHALLESRIHMALPEGSLFITTGGAKGQSAKMTVRDIDTRLSDRFSAPVGSEYGMTELLSQAYRVDGDWFVLPPWCRVAAFDPATGNPCNAGEVGLLRFVDLANTQSSIAVQTADRGIVDNWSRFQLLGRAPGARIRGCSLTFEELGSDLGGTGEG